MASFFFDTSALAKRYIQETGSIWVSKICEDLDNDPIFVSALTTVEMISAICRRAKGSTLSLEAKKTAISDFDADLADQYFLIQINSKILTRARRLAEKYALRGYDSVQLATAKGSGQFTG